MFIYKSGLKPFSYCCACILPSLLLCFPPSAHFWQLARHGDKISEEKEQNVRMKNASFVFIIVLLLFSFSPAPTDFTSRGE